MIEVTREGSFNPVAVLVHVVAIAAGIVAGLAAMGAISPNLPADVDVDEPGVETPAADGDDSSSLFLSPNLEFAFDELRDENGAGAEYSLIDIQPGQITTESNGGAGSFTIDEVSASVPQTMIFELGEKRPEVTAEDVEYIQLAAITGGPRWILKLSDDSGLAPPLAYSARADGSRLEPVDVP